MKPYFTDFFGNAASQHSLGFQSAQAIEKARAQIASAIHCQEKEIYFTSGATESINLVIRGLWQSYGSQKNHFITSSVEHKAVLETYEAIEKQGAKITILPVNSEGFLEPETLQSAITEDTLLVSVIYANNEVGSINDLERLAKITKEKGSLFFTDAVQALGKVELNLEKIPGDFLCLSSHKFYGPKGAGILYIREQKPRLRLQAQLTGGGHEKGLRSGTLNVPAIVGMGEAAEICTQKLNDEINDMRKKRDYLQKKIEQNLMAQNISFQINGPKDLDRKLPHNLNLSIDRLQLSEFQKHLPFVAFSTGSACSSASAKPSYVLTAIGLDDDKAKSTVRFSVGRFTSFEELDAASDAIGQAISASRIPDIL